MLTVGGVIDLAEPAAEGDLGLGIELQTTEDQNSIVFQMPKNIIIIISTISEGSVNLRHSFFIVLINKQFNPLYYML